MKRTEKMVLCAIFVSLALALNYTERFIPLQLMIPLPGVKLGLANIVTLVSLYLLGWKSAFAVLVLRCLLGSLFGGGITGLLFSLTGGILAATVMIFAQKIPLFSLYGVSILGAAAHNIGQIIAAMVLMKTVYVLGYLPYLLMISVLMGMITGALSSGTLSGIYAWKKTNST